MVNPVTWKQLIEGGAAELIARAVPDPELSAEFLAAHVLKVWKRSEIKALEDKQVTEHEYKEFSRLLERRFTHEPVQYIIGETEFYGLRLFTTPAALIPRPETEVLVEEALKLLPAIIAEKKGTAKVLDIGTGTGAILLAIASKLPMIEGFGIDISGNAVALAKKNAAHLAVTNVHFEECDVFSHSIEGRWPEIDLIVSNPPYIGLDELILLEKQILQFEPRVALTDEAEGYKFYYRIAQLSEKLLPKNGATLVELSFNGSETVRNIFAERGFDTFLIKDLAGIDRVLLALPPLSGK